MSFAVQARMKRALAGLKRRRVENRPTVAELARQAQVSHGTAAKYAKLAGIVLPTGRGRYGAAMKQAAIDDPRNREIAKAVAESPKSLRELAVDFGLDWTRLQQIAKRAGVQRGFRPRRKKSS